MLMCVSASFLPKLFVSCEHHTFYLLNITAFIPRTKAFSYITTYNYQIYEVLRKCNIIKYTAYFHYSPIIPVIFVMEIFVPVQDFAFYLLAESL